MAVLPLLRRQALFAGDAIRGGGLASQVKEVEAIIAAPMSSASKARRDQHLRALLAHAAASVPFYRRLPSTSVLTDFPVMSRRTYQEQPEQMQSRHFDVSTLPYAQTSGSSGTPLRVPRDPLKQRRHLADLISFIRLAGYDFGDPVVLLANSDDPRSRRDPRRWRQAAEKVDASVYDEGLVHRFRAAVNSYACVSLISAPSALEYIGRRLNEDGIAFPPGKVRSVVTISETLTPWVRAHSAAVFGVPAVSRYSNWENGILAQQTLDSEQRYIVNHASYVFEVLAFDHDGPVAPGDVGRIVVTDLFARAMPLIRYDTGDLGSWAVEHPQQLQQVVGRQVDVLIAEDGRRVAPYVVMAKMLGFPGIGQFQLAQTGRLTLRLSLVAQQDPVRDEAITRMLREVLGAGVTVTLEYVDEVEVLPSGKRRPVTNLWKAGK